MAHRHACPGGVMIDISVIRDSTKRDAAFQAQLARTFSIDFKDLSGLATCKPGQYSLVDFELVDIKGIPILKEWIRNKPDGAKVIFVTNKASHLQTTRAFALGATGVVHQPIEPHILLDKLLGASSPAASESSNALAALSSDPGNAAIRKVRAVATALNSLRGIFWSACSGDPIDHPAISAAS